MGQRNIIELILKGTDAGVSSMLGKLGGGLSGLGSVAAGALGVLAGNLMTSAIGKIGELGRALADDLINEAPRLEGVRRTFNTLAADIGENSDVMMGAMREATRGMVSDGELMMASNKLVSMGLAASSSEAAELAEVATQLGVAMGEDATASMENFALMMANQSIPRLDSFGISSGAVRTRILELMDATADLSREEAFSQAVMEQAAVAMERVGEQGEGTAGTIANLQTTFQNLKDGALAALLPALGALLEPLGELAEQYGPMVLAWAEEMTPAFELLGKAIVFAFSGDVSGMIEAIWFALEILLGEETANLFLDLADTLELFGKAISFAFSGDVSGMIEAVWFALEGLLGEDTANLFLDFADSALEFSGTVLNAVEQIRSWFVTNWPIIQAVVVTAWTVIQDVIMAVVDVIVGEVWPSLQAAFVSIEEAMATLGISWSDVWEAIKLAVGIVAAAIGAILVALVGVIVGIVEAAANTLAYMAETWELLAANVKRITEGIAQVIFGWWNFLQGLFSGNTEQMRAGWDVFWEGMKNLAVAAWNNIVLVYRSTFGILIEALSGFVEGFIGFFTNLYDRLVGHSIVPEMMAAILTAITSKFEEILSWLGGKVAAFSDLGAALMNGLKDGIMGAVQGVIDAVVAAIEAAIAAAQAAADMFSPSRRMAEEVGEPPAEGIGVGLERAMGKVRDSMGGLMGGLVGAGSGLAPAAAGAGIGGAQVAIYGPIHVYGVQDARGLIEELQELAG